MKRFIIFLMPLLFLGNEILKAQQHTRHNYGNFATKIENGNFSMQLAPADYSMQTLESGIYKTKLGFLSVLVNNSVVDSLALVDLYNATNPGDTTWVNADGWLTAPLDQWNGITLGSDRRVIEVWLAENNLVGALPESFKNLDSLKRFYFWNNPELSGNLFDFLLNYPALERVSAHDCSFSGTMLPEVFHPNLLEIRVFNNQLTGEIPAEIGNSTLMDQFNVAGNQLTGSIPNTIGSLSKVWDFSLSRNQITGSIPIEIGQMDSLRIFSLEDLNLEGEVPSEILNCSKLEELWFIRNNFSGTLPAVLNLPNFRILHVGGNRNLFVDLPDNIGDLTRLEFLSIWNTKANGGAFPEGIYNLTNLNHLDLSGQAFTGTIDTRIGNLTNLTALFLRSNFLEGAFPSEITAAQNLTTFDISSNNFNFLPNISALPNLQTVNLTNNQFQFESLLPYVGLSNYNFKPQKQIGSVQDIELAIGASQELITAIGAFENITYNWILNGDSISNSNTNTWVVNNFSTNISGRYQLRTTHPALIDFILLSAPINLKIAGGKTNWYVDNREGTIADFRSINQAIAATKSGDTLYMAGSPKPYTGFLLPSPRTIIGPGYFLDENEETQFNKNSAHVDGVISLIYNLEQQSGRNNSNNSKIFGIEVNDISLQNIVSLNDTLSNILIDGVKIKNIFIGGNTKNLDIKNSFIGEFMILAEEIPGLEISAFRKNNVFQHNIIRRLISLEQSSGFSPELTNAPNIGWNYNIIDTIYSGIENFTFTNSLIRVNNSSNAILNNTTVGDFSTVLLNNSGDFSVDNDFTSIENTLDKGAFAGNNPYRLSGLPPVPSIYHIEIGPRLSAKLNVKSNNGNKISLIRYLYRRNNQSSTPFIVRGFNPTNDLEVEFLPNRSVVEPNQTYDLVFQAIDQSGKRSHRTYIPYETIAANLSGKVVDINNVNVNQGNVRLFAINPFANKYDTAAVQALAGSNTFNFQNLILGDYIILADPDEIQYPDLIPTYLGNTLDWQVADTLFLVENTNNVTIEVEKQPAPLTRPGSEIKGFIVEVFDDSDSTLRILSERRVSSTGVSVRRLAGSSRTVNSLRLLEEDYELVAYVKSDENGDFSIPNLPTGDYKIRIEYPGVENDETSDVDFNLSGQLGNIVEVKALVEDGLVKITQTKIIVANEPDKTIIFRFYPNPAKNEINLMLENASEANELTIFDLKGVVHKRIQLENGQTKVDLNYLATGTYIIRLLDKKGNYMMSKLIKN